MLSLRARLFIIISIVVLLILAFSIVILVTTKKKPATSAPAPAAETGQVIQNSNFEQNQNVIIPQTAPLAPSQNKPTTLQTEQNSVIQLAKIFAERFNTYSTDNNGQNILEVKDLVTVDMWKKISGKLSAPHAASFSGSATEALTASLLVWNLPAAQVKLQVRQTLEQSGKTTRSYANYTVSLVKIANQWLVDKYEWAK